MPANHPARTGKNYVQIWATPSGETFEHRAIAERVLGRPLPRGAEIHHVDGNRRHNSHGNLVICQDKAYHKLLHARARIVAAGGNPNTERLCSRCRLVLPIASFGRSSKRQLGTQNACKSCGNEYRSERRAA